MSLLLLSLPPLQTPSLKGVSSGSPMPTARAGLRGRPLGASGRRGLRRASGEPPAAQRRAPAQSPWWPGWGGARALAAGGPPQPSPPASPAVGWWEGRGCVGRAEGVDGSSLGWGGLRRGWAQAQVISSSGPTRKPRSAARALEWVGAGRTGKQGAPLKQKKGLLAEAAGASP